MRVETILDRVRKHGSFVYGEMRFQETGAEPVLKNTGWVLLERPENLSEKQEIRLADLLRHNLKTVRAYQVLRRNLSSFRTMVSGALRSRIEPLKKVATLVRRYRALLLDWFRAEDRLAHFGGIVEGFDTKAKLTTRKAFGFRTYWYQSNG